MTYNMNILNENEYIKAAYDVAPTASQVHEEQMASSKAYGNETWILNFRNLFPVFHYDVVARIGYDIED